MPAATALYPSIEARLANLRAALLDMPDTSPLRDRLSARVADLVVASNEVPGDLAALAPALERWRREVFFAGASARPLELAAAWEVTALELERVGDPEAARDARHYAAIAICQP